MSFLVENEVLHAPKFQAQTLETSGVGSRSYGWSAQGRAHYGI